MNAPPPAARRKRFVVQIALACAPGPEAWKDCPRGDFDTRPEADAHMAFLFLTVGVLRLLSDALPDVRYRVLDREGN